MSEVYVAGSSHLGNSFALLAHCSPAGGEGMEVAAKIPAREAHLRHRTDVTSSMLRKVLHVFYPHFVDKR